ncbi:MAG TPA: aminotransferase class V-fold PLP-dependent enzyme [Clostridiaceae bacterium]
MSEFNYYRSLVAGSESYIPLKNGKYVKAINLDNAATTPPFHSVLDEIIKFSPFYSSIHRGYGYKSELSSYIYDTSRYIVKDFVGASSTDTVIYVKNTTEAINKLSNRLCYERDSVVLSTDMEHHSNDLPWRKNFKVDYIELDQFGGLSLKSLEEKLRKYKDKIKLVTVTGASNVTGIINPIHYIAEIVHKHNIKLLVDGAQLVPHCPISMKSTAKDKNDCIDYLVFSAHKMYAPFGIGVLIGPKSTFDYGNPDCVGGGTVKLVTHNFIEWDDPPAKEEGGSPNIIGVVALVASIKTLNQISMDKVYSQESYLTEYTLEMLKSLPEARIYGDTTLNNRLGIISFDLKDIPHQVVGRALACEGGISVRTGCFCAQPYIQKLLNISNTEIMKYINKSSSRPGLVRISHGIYNIPQEIDRTYELLKKIIKNKAYYLDKFK